MTEPNLSALPLTAATPAHNPKRKPARTARAIVATLLSLLFPGFGQIHVRRISRGIIFALAATAVAALSAERHLMLTFPAMPIVLTLGVVCRLAMAIDAFLLARKYDPAAASPRDWKKTIGAFLLVFLLVVYPVPDYLQRHLLRFFRANKIASSSMCPTLCIGERVVVNKEAYDSGPPQRGDIIVFQYKQETAPFLKRVIGIEGDTVSQGLGNSILVNGNPIPKPQVCGGSLPDDQSEPGAIQFCPIKVPADALFVVGDNLANSLDSRFPDFGLVNVDHVRGKPIYIYWSRQISRIGCTLR